MSIQVSDQLSIEFVYGDWVVTGARIRRLTFSRLAHACKYIVDSWAGHETVQHEAASMIDVIEHMGDRLHDAVIRVGKAHSADTKRLDWLCSAGRSQRWDREGIDAAMERAAGAQESEV